MAEETVNNDAPVEAVQLPAENWIKFLDSIAMINEVTPFNLRNEETHAEGMVGFAMFAVPGRPPAVISNVTPEVVQQLILFHLSHAATVTLGEVGGAN